MQLKSVAGRNLSMDINLFMPGNQSFNRGLYAPLTRAPLVCTRAVYLKRKVYMKQRPILRWILSAGVLVQMILLLCCVPLRAQSAGDITMADPADPLGVRKPEFLTVDDEKKPEKRVLSGDHAPGDVHGLVRYPNGLPMAGAQVVILSADVDVERSTVSAQDGTYVFKRLKPGNYQVAARIDGFDTLYEFGLRMVINGLTTIEEVERTMAGGS